MSTTNNRRERGYRFERYIVDFFNKSEEWIARRLGGSSTGLPDIVMTNNNERTIFTVEAKSTVGKAAYIPNDQIVRCIEILDMFNIYRHRNVIFAFKFAKSKHNTSLQYHFFRFHPYDLKWVETLKCESNGYLSIKSMKEKYLQDLSLSFIRHQEIKWLRDHSQAPFTDTL